jgi:hypothetical protein
MTPYRERREAGEYVAPEKRPPALRTTPSLAVLEATGRRPPARAPRGVDIRRRPGPQPLRPSRREGRAGARGEAC